MKVKERDRLFGLNISPAVFATQTRDDERERAVRQSGVCVCGGRRRSPGTAPAAARRAGTGGSGAGGSPGEGGPHKVRCKLCQRGQRSSTGAPGGFTGTGRGAAAARGSEGYDKGGGERKGKKKKGSSISSILHFCTLSVMFLLSFGDKDQIPFLQYCRR